MVSLNYRDYAGLQQLLDLFDILGNWNHSIVVLTHGTAIGGTEDEQYKTFTDLLQDVDGPPILIDLVKKVNDRFVIVEAKYWRSDTAYRNGVVTKLLSLSDDISSSNMVVIKTIYSQLEGRHMKSLSPFSYVREAVLKLVCIKLADGEDVDKLKEMNELKEKMLEEIRMQRDQLYQEFLKKEKRRKEGQEGQKRIKEELHIVKEKEEKDKALKKLDECHKKQTFNERRPGIDVSMSNDDDYGWGIIRGGIMQLVCDDCVRS